MARDRRELAAQPRPQTAEDRSRAEQRGIGRGTRQDPVNPFYVLVVLFAVLFTLASFLYLATDLSATGPQRSGIARFMAEHGTAVLLTLGGCIVATCLASMALDSYRWRGTKRVVKRREDDEGG